MDPNPNRFPILSYILSHLQKPPQHDLENPPPSQSEIQLLDRMPKILHPHILSSMIQSISDVAQTRSILHSLGDRPDHETIDAARSQIAEIDNSLAGQPDEVKAGAQKLPYVAVLKLDEMHEAYEKLLKEAEERLERMYVSSCRRGVEAREEEEEEEGWNENVVAVLKEAAVRCVDRVELLGQGIRFLPEEFGRIRGLVCLNVSGNQLESIPDAISGLEQLEELHLSSNVLISLPDSIGLLLNLKILDVSSNKLKAFPDSISHCRSLVELNASYNELTYLPTNIGYELVNLQKLWIYLNKLRSLPTSICEMRSLRLLDAHFNELHGLPYAIGKLVNLEILNLSSNFSDMKELPPTFGDLINLRELDISNNQIHALPDSFGRLDKLHKLNLDQNPLFIPPMEIVNQGVEAVILYMSKRWLDILLEEERNSQMVENPQEKTGWLTRSTSWLSNFVTGVSGTAAEYIGARNNSYRDPCLDQQL